MRTSRLARVIILTAIISVLALTLYLNYQLHSVAVTRYTVPIKNLPSAFNGFTILMMSDLHSKNYGENQERLLAIIHKQDYDLIAMTGDFVYLDQPIDPAMSLIKGLKDKPMYYVSGNHDWWTDLRIKQPITALGVRFLQNQAVKYSRDGEHLWIIGVDDPYLRKSDLDAAVKTVTDTSPSILLAHSPTVYESAVRSNIDLVLTGHTHGGQVRIPFVGAINVPGQGYFPDLDYGLFSSGRTNMVITSGLGENVYPIRFNCRPEIILITLKKSD